MQEPHWPPVANLLLFLPRIIEFRAPVLMQVPPLVFMAKVNSTELSQIFSVPDANQPQRSTQGATNSTIYSTLTTYMSR